MAEAPEAAKAPSGANSPYKIKKQGGKWCVVNNIGETKASFPGNDDGYQRALKYQRALYVNVKGAPKRADKVKWSGKARNRVPEKSLAERMADTYGTSATTATSVEPGEETAAYSGSGCMVALFVEGGQAEAFAKAGGSDAEDAEDMHVTLAYMKETPEGEDLLRLQQVVAAVAQQYAPLDGVWGGTGKFNPSPGSDGKPVTVALPDLPGLAPMRQALVEALDGAGFEVSKDHGYTPHMTIAYDDVDDVEATGTLHFDQLSLATADDRWDYGLGAKPMAEAAEEAHDTKHKKHRFVGAHHVRDGVVSTAGYFHGCYACGSTQGVGDHQGSCSDPGTAGTTPGSTSAEGAELAELSIPNTIAALDAVIDQIMVLLRSTPTEDLPPYAQQAKDLLGAADLALDGLMASMNIPDPDGDEGPDKNDAGPEASRASAREGVGRFYETRERQPQVEDAPASLPAVRAFLTEVNGKTLLTAPASTFAPQWEKALTPNPHFMWMQGRFVGAEEANRNGAFWSNADLEMGAPTVQHGPLNWLHEDRHVIGSIVDAKLVDPSAEQAAAGAGKHIAAVSAAWKWLYPDECFVIESASDANTLFYSMECISKEVSCVGEGSCGMSFPYQQTVQDPDSVCQHIRQRSATRRFVDPTFLGGAAIVPPVRPGWGEANANVLRQAASLAERAFEQAGQPDISASTWEHLMAAVLTYAGA